MTDLVRGEANDQTNPRVLFAWQPANVGDDLDVAVIKQFRGGFFQPITELEFRVLRPDGTELLSWTVVDIEDDANVLDRRDQGGKGRIIILPFTVAEDEPTGFYTVEVEFTVTPEGGQELTGRTASFSIRVLDEDQLYVEGAYAQIQDMLDAGFPIGNPAPIGGYSFADAARALSRATSLIEMITQRVFGAHYRVFDINGKGGPALQLDHVIIGLTQVTFTFTTFTPADLPIEEGDIRVYNRHIRQKLLQPDDRQDPRIEFLRTPIARFPRSQLFGDVDMLSGAVGFVDSQQNVKLRGMWGYTDSDGSPFGKIPELIKEAALRLAARYIQPLWKQIGGVGNNAGPGGPVLMEKTLDQQVQFADVSGGSNNTAFVGNFTGDPEIDNILAMFMAPPRYRSA